MLKAKSNILPQPDFSAETQAKWDKDFFFIQAADTQLGLMYNFGSDGSDGTPYPESKWETEIELCKASVEILNVDAFGDKFPEIRQRQEKDLKEIYSKLSPDIPMICVCGNHDIGNSPTAETINSYKASFGDDYFSFYKNGCCFIVLNSQFYEDASNVPELYAEHEKWLESELATAAERGVKHTVVFQHIPWFVQKSDEEKIYFNVEKELRIKKLEQFHKAGVRKIFCGHYHRNAGGFYKDLEVVVTSAIGCQIGPDEHGMRVVKVKEDALEHQYHPLDNFPTRVIL